MLQLTSIPTLARNANRLREIGTILARYGLAEWLHRLDIHFARGLFKGRDGTELSEHSQETRVRLALSDLGPTFIKLGQMLSTRPDLVGNALAEELARLRDDVAADPPERVRATIEAELGQPIGELFAEFEDHPLGSASIGQVHRARLHDGTSVVVKLQHPEVESRLRIDLDILIGIAELVEKYLPEFQQYRPRATAAEFQRTLLRELDFGREERNLQQFANNFARNDGVHFPTTYPDYSTNRVLTMELLDGIKLSDPVRLQALHHDLNEIARRGAVAFLDMIFRDGFYHADPHPGNLMVLRSGVIGVLDCGSVGRLDQKRREEIEDVLLAIATADAQGLTTKILRLAAAPPNIDQGRFSTDITDFLSYHGSQGLAQLSVGKALQELFDILRRYQLVLPADLAMLLRVLILLEGTSRLLSPSFSLIELIRPYQRTLLRRRLSPMRHVRRLRRLYQEMEYVAEVLPRLVIDLLQQVQQGRFTVPMEHRHLEPAINRLVFGMLTSALFLGSALLWSHHVPPLLGGVPVFGALGCILSAMLGIRLLWAINRSGHLDP